MSDTRMFDSESDHLGTRVYPALIVPSADRRLLIYEYDYYIKPANRFFLPEIKVTGFLHDENVLESQSTVLQCAVDVPGYFDGQWLHNGHVITNTNQRVIETKGTTQLLTLTNVTSDDAGSYSYVTGSGTGTEAKLFVLPIHIVSPLCDADAAETKTVKLELKLSHEGVDGTWWKDGVQLQVRDCLI